MSEPSQTGRGVPRHFRSLGSDRQELLLSKQETGKRETSLTFWPGRMISHQNLCEAFDHFFEIERLQVGVQGTSHWATLRMHGLGSFLIRGASLGYRLLLPWQEGSFSGMVPAQLKGWVPYGTPTPSSVNGYFWGGGGEAKDPAEDRWHLLGMFCKLETLRAHGKEEVNPCL